MLSIPDKEVEAGRFLERLWFPVSEGVAEVMIAYSVSIPTTEPDVTYCNTFKLKKQEKIRQRSWTEGKCTG